MEKRTRAGRVVNEPGYIPGNSKPGRHYSTEEGRLPSGAPVTTRESSTRTSSLHRITQPVRIVFKG
jgi:hypothetical protein